MGCGESIRSVDRIAWAGESGLNNARPRSEGRQPGPGNPSEAKTPAEALSHIELLYQSGRMEDLAKLLRKSKVFRAAWLILQQSSPDLSEAAGEEKRSSNRRESGGPASLPVPAGGAPRPARDQEPRSPGALVSRGSSTESPTLIPAAGMASDRGNDFFARRSQAGHPLSLLLQAYLNQDDYWAREGQRGQLVNIRS